MLLRNPYCFQEQLRKILLMELINTLKKNSTMLVKWLTPMTFYMIARFFLMV